MRRVAGGAAFAALLGVVAFSSPSVAADPPQFQVDPFWPKPLPNNWLFGQIGGLAVDSNDHVWVLQRPRSLTEDERGATLKPPRNNCCVPAPSVLGCDADGNFVQGWGGPGTGAEWVGREHGIFVDHKGFVWLGGNADTDSAIFKYTKDGKLVMEIGKIGPSKGSNDTTMLGKPADIQVDPATNEVFVADGYGNRRVIVFDANTGAYKRHWGAYGNKPDDRASKARQTTGAGPQQFNTPHGIEVSNDGIVYVTDRANNRVQSFTLDGKFLKEGFIKRESQGTGTAFGVGLSADPAQRFLYIAD